jgi:hypothetical protein
VTAEDQLMEMLFRAYIVCEQPTPDHTMSAICAACTGPRRWYVSTDLDKVKTAAEEHIRSDHLPTAVLTIDAMRRRTELEADETTTRHRLERLRLGLKVLRDQLDGVTRNDIVLKPQAAHARVRSLLGTTKLLLAADKLLSQGAPAELRLARKGVLGVG